MGDNNYNDLIKNIHKHISIPEDNDIIILPHNFKFNTITDDDIKYNFFHNKSDIPKDFDIEMCKKNMAKYYLYIYLIINIFYKQLNNDDNNLNDIIKIYFPEISDSSYDYNISGGESRNFLNELSNNILGRLKKNSQSQDKQKKEQEQEKEEQEELLKQLKKEQQEQEQEEQEEQ